MYTSLLTIAALAGVLSISVIAGAQLQSPAPLWPDGAPGALGKEAGDIPTITVYTPPADKASDAAVVVCPGGGYGGLADHEGKPIAEWLNSSGITGVVLRYRLGPKYHHPIEMGDVARAIRYVRSHAAEWKLDPRKIGVMGFSAGGHLASTAATHFDAGDPTATDPIDKMSSRPDVAILIYPVITMTDPFTHGGSRSNLLGDNPAPELIKLMSNEKQVTSKTPPTFLVHTYQDSAVPVENSLMFVAALRRNHVPFELHVFEKGEHGYGLSNKSTPNGAWPDLCAAWLHGLKFGK